MQYVAYVQKRGRIGIPHELRDFLNIEEGDMVIVKILKVQKKNGVEVQDGGSWLKDHGQGD